MGRHKGRHTGRNQGTAKDKKQDKAIKSIRKDLAPEEKVFLVGQASSATQTTLKYTVLDNVPQGANNNNRIGGKIKVRHLAMNLFVRQTGSVTQFLYRAFIVRTTLNNLSTVTDSDVIAGTTSLPLSQFNTGSLVEGGKFSGRHQGPNAVKVLWDSGPVVVQPWSGTATGYIADKASHLFKIRIPLNHQTTYSDGTTQQPDHNGLWLIAVSDNGAVVDAFESRLQFTDS